MTTVRNCLFEKAEIDESPYERFGKLLEDDHVGEVVGMSPVGEAILGDNVGDAVRQAQDAFGSGNFAIARVGHDAVWKWLSLTT